MNVMTVVIGVAALLFGATTLFLRAKDPSKFRKLQPMQERFGKTAGTVVHTVAYSLVPMGAGITFLVAGLNGVALF